jgi:hypothetical protein
VRAVALSGVALLPGDVRDLYGLSVDPVTRSVFGAGRACSRRLLLAKALPRVWSTDGHGLPLRLLAALS